MRSAGCSKDQWFLCLTRLKGKEGTRDEGSAADPKCDQCDAKRWAVSAIGKRARVERYPQFLQYVVICITACAR